MEPEEKQLNEQESLALIQRMIQSAQKGVGDSGFYFLLWGWLVFVASASCYTFVKLELYEYAWWPWAILMPLGGIASFIYGWKVESKKKVKTYADGVLDYVAIAFGASLLITLAFLSQSVGWAKTYPVIMMIYGSWLFISGAALKFRPLIIGGIVNWCCAIGGFFIKTEELILLLSFAVLAGYIVPGHLLKAQYEREKKDAAV